MTVIFLLILGGITMSIEREFLKKLRYASLLENDLRKELEELLAQPEQEPEFNFDLERMKVAIESPISDVTVDDLAKQTEQEPLCTQINFKDSSGKLITVDTYFVRELVERYAEVSSEGTWHRKGYKDRSWGI